MDVETYLLDFLRYLKVERNYSEKTLLNYERDIRDFLQFLVETGRADLPAVQARDVRIYIGVLYDRGYKRSTMQRHLSSLRSFYRFLLQHQVVQENPFAYVVMQKREKRLPQFFYEEEMQALFAATEGTSPLRQRDQALLEILYASGMRVSECVSLTVSDIHDESFILITGKGNKQRYVPVNQHALAAVQQYMKGGRLALMKKAEPHPYLFVNHLGNPLTDRGVRYVLNQIIKRSSLQAHIHPHELRHTFATHLLNHGADMRTVQELLGHVDLSSTQIYAHVTKESLQRTYLACHPRAKKENNNKESKKGKL